MAFGATAGQQQDPLGDYMRNYGDRLRSMLASDPTGGMGPTTTGATPPSAFQSSDPGVGMSTEPSLGPDNYQPPAAAPRSALEAAGQGQSPGKGEQGQQGWGFRDLWQKQTEKQREQLLDKLDTHLKQADQSIDGAYKQMMAQLGGRPDTKLSRDQKGMLLMEFGMRMMQNSSGRYGYGTDIGAAAGAAGASTMQDAMGMVNQNRNNQLQYDRLKQQIAIAGGREKAALASRSALEEGRDIRSMLSQDTQLAKTDMQQSGANQRNDDRIAGQNEREKQRESAAAGMFTHFTTGEDGYVYGTNRSGKTIKVTDNSGQPIKAPPGGLGGKGGRGTAAQANYNLYVQTYGKDDQGAPLTGPDMQRVEQDAIMFASNPRAFQLSDPQMKQMAAKSADNFIRSNQIAWAGMQPEEIKEKRDEFAEQEYQRLRRNGQAGPTAAAPGPRSALERPGSSPGKPAGSSPGAIPTQPLQGGKTPNAAQLKALQENPQKIAPYFLRKFGYIPAEYTKFATPQSALQ